MHYYLVNYDENFLLYVTSRGSPYGAFRFLSEPFFSHWL